MSGKIVMSYVLINKTERTSGIRVKKRKKKSELIAESENNSDAILEHFSMSDSDIELGGNVTSCITQSTYVTYHTVEVMSDVPTFVGSDEQCYTLKTGDRVIVPADQAKVLFNRGMAVLVDDAVRFKNNS